MFSSFRKKFTLYDQVLTCPVKRFFPFAARCDVRHVSRSSRDNRHFVCVLQVSSLNVGLAHSQVTKQRSRAQQSTSENDRWTFPISSRRSSPLSWGLSDWWPSSPYRSSSLLHCDQRRYQIMLLSTQLERIWRTLIIVSSVNWLNMDNVHVRCQITDAHVD